MGVTQAQRLLSPEEIAVQAGQQAPFLRLPERASLFAERALRLRQLAAGHAMRDYLLFAAEIAQAQQALLDAYPAVALPDATTLEAAAKAGQPPLAADRWPRDPAWRRALHQMLDALLPRLGSSPAAATVRAVRAWPAEELERQADKLLTGVSRGLDLAAAPLVAAGLQACFTHLVLATGAARGADRLPPFGRTDDPTRCPCCGSLPVASILRIGGEGGGFRYLHCALCSAQWHMVRIKCARCQGTKGIGYQTLQPLPGQVPAAGGAVPPGAVQAETCDSCGHYLKIVQMQKDAHVDPVADDLASLTLDLLVSEAGQQRHGLNLLLLFGEGDPPDPGAP